MGVGAGQVNYGTAKAGIAGMTLILAIELQRYGVTANAISPQARTRITEGAFDPSLLGPDASGFDAWDPANVSPVVGWLASDAAADVTGQHFVVYGGDVHVMEGWTEHNAIHRGSRLDGRRPHRPQGRAVR